MAARRPKIVKRSNGKQRQGYSKLRRLIRCVAFIPLFCLLLERVFFFPFEENKISGYLDVKRVAVTNTIKKKNENADLALVLSSTITPEKARKSLQALTQPFRVTDTSFSPCSVKGTKIVTGYHHLGMTTVAESGTKVLTSLRREIPRILQQQGSSRCVPSALYDLNEEWEKQLTTDKKNGEEWSMYFHTEDAMTRLFQAIIAVNSEDEHSKHSITSRIGREFPHLGQILRNCVVNGSFSKRLLWRFLCLYIYGGMYVNLEYALPPVYHDNAKKILRDGHDTVLLWSVNEDNLQEMGRPKNKNNLAEVRINPNIMAVSPGHPFMYYAVQHALLQITTENLDNELEKSTENSVVSNVLKRALSDFLQEHDLKSESVLNDEHLNSSSNESSKSKAYSGTCNTTVTILDAPTVEATGTASEVEFSQKIKSLKGKRTSSFVDGVFNGNGGTSLERSRGEPSSCLRKLLADTS